MRIRHRYGLSTEDRQIIRFLKRYNIPFQQDELTITTVVFEDDDEFDSISEFFKKKDVVDVVDAVYDKSELEAADWLTIKSEWWTQYPQPEEEMRYIFSTYDASTYCKGLEGKYYCGKGLKQVQPFVIKKEPNWGARNFMMLNWIPDELFISSKASNILLKSSLVGFSLWDVLDKSYKPHSSIKQIYVEKYLHRCIDQTSIEQKNICPNCGFEKFIPKVGMIKFKKEFFENLNCDIVKTMDKFGEIGCDSLILVSHKFYDVIKKIKLVGD